MKKRWFIWFLFSFSSFSLSLFLSSIAIHEIHNGHIYTQASNKSQHGRRYSNTNLVHRYAWLDNSHYHIFIHWNGAYQTNPIHQTNVTNKYPWYVRETYERRYICHGVFPFCPFLLYLFSCECVGVFFCASVGAFVHNRLASFLFYCIFVMRFFYSLLGCIEKKARKHRRRRRRHDKLSRMRLLSVIIYHFYGFN